MTLVKWSPINSMGDIFDSFDSIFHHGFNRVNGLDIDDFQLKPSVNVKEDDDQYFVSIDLPGVEKRDLQLSIADGFMKVIAERKDLLESKNENRTWKEACIGKYERSFELPVSVNEDKIKANFKNGVLNLTIPKEEVVSKEKKITIN